MLDVAAVPCRCRFRGRQSWSLPVIASIASGEPVRRSASVLFIPPRLSPCRERQSSSHAPPRAAAAFTPISVQTAAQRSIGGPITSPQWLVLRSARWQTQNTRRPSDRFSSSRNMPGFRSRGRPSNIFPKAACRGIRTETPNPMRCPQAVRILDVRRPRIDILRRSRRRRPFTRSAARRETLPRADAAYVSPARAGRHVRSSLSAPAGSLDGRSSR